MDDIYVFEGFRLYRPAGGLFRRDARAVSFVPIAIGSRALDVLGVLVGRPGDLVSRAEIIAAVWPSTVVEDSNLNMQIAALRRILDDGRADGSCIQTIPGRGYRFTAAVTRVAAEGPSNAAAGPQSGVGARAGLSIVVLPFEQGVPPPDKPPVAVLPFQNLTGDPRHGFVSDGISHDIITALSRYSSLLVLSGSSCFAYKGSVVDVRQVGRELGARYVLEGSMREAGNKVRLIAQLVEAETRTHLWAARYDRELADVFRLQDKIAADVTTAIAPVIGEAERQRAARRPTGGLDPWSACQRGWWHMSRLSVEDNTLAKRFFQQAIDLDPTFAGGYKGLVSALADASTVFCTCDLREAQGLSNSLARRAIALDGADAEARACLGAVLWHRGDPEGARAEAERALVKNPTLARGHTVLGMALIHSGQAKEGLTALKRSIRLDPRDPGLAARLNQIAVALFYLRRYEASAEVAQQMIRSYPEFPPVYRWLAAAFGQLGRTDEAKNALERAVSLAPAWLDTYVRQGAPWMRPVDHANLIEGLRKAGLPG
jgi:adenylate cyclase